MQRGATVGVVKASKSSKFPVGANALTMTGWRELAIANEKDLELLEIPKNGKVTDGLGILGNYQPPLKSPLATLSD